MINFNKNKKIIFIPHFLSLVFIFFTFISGFAEFNTINSIEVNQSIVTYGTLTDSDILEMRKSRDKLKEFVKSKIKNSDNIKIFSEVREQSGENESKEEAHLNGETKNNESLKEKTKSKKIKKAKKNKNSKNWVSWIVGGVISLASIIAGLISYRKCFSSGKNDNLKYVSIENSLNDTGCNAAPLFDSFSKIPLVESIYPSFQN